MGFNQSGPGPDDGSCPPPTNMPRNESIHCSRWAANSYRENLQSDIFMKSESQSNL